MPESVDCPSFATLAVDPSTGEADALLAAVARGESAAWPAEWRGARARSIMLDRVDFHGVSGVLLDQLDTLKSWPRSLAAALRERAIGAAMWELSHRRMLRQLTDALADAGVEALLLKGTALAYSHYPDPALRQRGDSDVLVQGPDHDRARDVLRSLDFNRFDGNLWPEAQRYQEVWSRTCGDGTTHVVDLHFDLFNSPAMAGAVGFSDCVGSKQPLPGIGPNAFAPRDATLLLHACIHREFNRVARYFIRGRETTGGNRLIWLMDIDRLVRALNRQEAGRFVELVVQSGQGEACLAGLDAAADALATPVPNALRSPIAELRPRGSAYLRRGPFGRALADLEAVTGLGPRFRYARARFVPGAGRRLVHLLRRERG